MPRSARIIFDQHLAPAERCAVCTVVVHNGVKSFMKLPLLQDMYNLWVVQKCLENDEIVLI